MSLKQIFTAICFLLVAMSIGAEVPNVVNYQGRLTDTGGDPVADGPFLVKFIIYDADVNGNEIWNSEFKTINTVGGVFSYQLGSNVVLPAGIFSNPNRYLGITVGTDSEIIPRTQFVTTSYAFKAENADVALDANSLGGAVPSYYLDWNNLTNVPAGFADGTDDDAGGDITSVTAGTALEGGGTSGDVSLNLAPTIASDHLFNGTIRFGDSTLFIDTIITIGTPTPWLGSYYIPLIVQRGYNTTSRSVGIHSYLENNSTGDTRGMISIGLNNGTNDSYGVFGLGSKFNGAFTGNTYGVYGEASRGAISYGIYGYSRWAGTNWAGYFDGNVHVTGTLSKAGGLFKIDHPLDPENKYLQHSFVESPDMMNIYNGNIVTDANGFATVEMPEYFDALNKDFRYQLTVIETFAQAIIAEKISDRQFVIQTDIPNIEVSWMVTGIRKDVWANANRIQVEVDKPTHEIGTYMHSKEYGMPVERDANYKNIKESLERQKEIDAQH